MMVYNKQPISKNVVNDAPFKTLEAQMYFAIGLAQIFAYELFCITNEKNEKFYFCKNSNDKYINAAGIFDNLKELTANSNFLYKNIQNNIVKIDLYDFLLNNKKLNGDKLENTRNYIYKHAIDYTDDNNKSYYSKNKPLDDVEFSKRPFVKRKLFFSKDKVATAIDIDFQNEEIRIKNFTNNIFKRAFGINETPTWKEYQEFLEDRCIPRTRYGIKDVLRNLGLQDYDVEEYVKKTHAKTADDKDWVLLEEEIEL